MEEIKEAEVMTDVSNVLTSPECEQISCGDSEMKENIMVTREEESNITENCEIEAMSTSSNENMGSGSSENSSMKPNSAMDMKPVADGDKVISNDTSLDNSQSETPSKNPEKDPEKSPSTLSDALQPSFYHIKWINWNDQKTPIITQNENGPCPLIAITNVLILKGRLKLNPNTEIITSQQLMEYVGDCIIDSVPKNASTSTKLNYEQNVNDAMLILPKLQTGLDVNVKFTGIADFEYTPECIVFDLLHIPLYHGWLVDPETPEYQAAVGRDSYNQLVERIINNKASSQPEIVTEALLAEAFLEKTASQLTYHGLCELNISLKDGELCVLFRNNHFITLFKHEKMLLQLLTDQGFLNEPEFIWETLNNIEGDGHFVNSDYKIIPPKPPVDTSPQCSKERQIDQDYLVALSLQTEEEHWKQPTGSNTLRDAEYAQRLQEEENQIAAMRNRQDPQNRPQPPRERRNDNGSSCTIL